MSEGGYNHTPQDVRNSLAARDPNNSVTDPMMKRSSDSAAMLEYFDLTDTLVDGITAMRNAGDQYLPKFTDEAQTDYDFRLRCTKMTNVYRDAVEGLASKPFEQEVSLSVDDNKPAPSVLTDFVENVDGSGNNLSVFASGTFFNGINSAIDWILIDYSKPDPTVRTRADQQRAGLRPYWSRVLGRNVLEPRSTVINGSEVITYVRIYEPGTVDHIRVFMRADNGAIRWALFRKTDTTHDVVVEWMPDVKNYDKTMFAIEDEGVLTIDVIPLVPFITGRRDGRSWRFFPAMRDAADLQVELYQQESALKFVKVLAAYPMLSGNGVKPPMQQDGKTPAKLAVGPGRVLYAPPDGNGNSGSWLFVEPSATTMKFLGEENKETMQQLRELARQPLIAGNTTVITAARGASKSKSAVKTWALGLKDALENALVITCKWLNIKSGEYDPVVSVFTEFDEFLEGKDLDALQAARAAKDISRETYWDELRRRAVLSPEFNADVEEQRLLDELPGDGVDTREIEQ